MSTHASVTTAEPDQPDGSAGSAPVTRPRTLHTATEADLLAVRPRHVTSLQDAARALTERRATAEAGPAHAAPEGRHQRLSPRERIELLLDEDSFVELGTFARHRATGLGMEHKRFDTDGVVTGWGTVDGRQVFVHASDPRVFGGSLGEVYAAKVRRVMDLAQSAGAPIIGLNDGGGARIQEGIQALAGFGAIFAGNVRASGQVPQISVILGPCAGGSVYSPALTDFVFMVRHRSQMCITGPTVVEAVTGERTTLETLGGSDVHSTLTGVAAVVSEDEASCLADVRYLLSFLPSSHRDVPPCFPPSDPDPRLAAALPDIVPLAANQVYDVRDVIAAIVDDSELFELHDAWAPNVVCALARLDGHSVGIVANQPMVLAGALDIDAAEKAARFVRTCDAFGIPLVSLVDVPGFLPGLDQEHGGVIRRGAKLLYAYCEATVPRVQVILRKAYGGAYIVMDSKAIGADLSFAWPSNEIAVMGAEGAVGIIHRREIASSADPESRRRELVAEYAEELLGPFVAAEQGLVDEVIDPLDTRRVLVRALRVLRRKRSFDARPGHGNIPL